MDLDDAESDDSFFDEPRPSRRTRAGEKKSVEDLFGSLDDKKTENVRNSPAKSKVRFDLGAKSDKPDWLGPIEPKEAKSKDLLEDILTIKSDKKSTDLLDDILPKQAKPERKPATFENILKESKISTAKPATAPPKRDPPDMGSGLDKRRSRRGSGTGIEDVLGLFGGETDTGKDKHDTISVKTTDSVAKVPSQASSDVPDWLGGTQKSDTTIKSSTDISKEAKIDHPVPADLHGTLSAMQQQESFLLVSMQLKKYEDNLESIKRQQEKILAKQEDQFETFLNTYISKQQEIEGRMLEQQKRINDHIRNLLGKSSETDDEDVTKSESGFESTVLSLKQRHSEEFFLMEESYKKQLSLLEKSTESVEERLNQELTGIARAFEEKLANVKKMHDEEIQYWEQKLKSSEERHGDELNRLKDHHSRLVSELKEEYLQQIERLKEARHQEVNLVSKGEEFSRQLGTGIENLMANTQTLQNLQDKVVADYGVLSIAREKSIEAKEKEIILMRQTLDKCRASAEAERSQLLGLIRSLEGKIAEQSRLAQEERWALQQTAATLAARSSAMDRELEFSRASIEREREQLKTLKETLLEEQERVTLQLTEEKLRLAAEKARSDVSNKLAPSYEVEKIKTEAETAIEVAKELSERLNQERDIVQRQKLDLDNFRRKLVEKERELADREADLENTSRTLHGRAAEDRRLAREAKYLENSYKEKLAELQSQAAALSAREKKVTEEKLSLSKERLALFTALKQKRCVLCTAEGEKFEPVTGRVQFLEHTVSDPDLVRLRMEALEDERTSEVSREDSHLMTT